MSEAKPDLPKSSSEEDVKSHNLFERVKEEIEVIFHTEKSHHKETHGTSDDIDENTPVDEIKAPGILERAKEEIEALIQAVHPKKESDNVSPSKR